MPQLIAGIIVAVIIVVAIIVAIMNAAVDSPLIFWLAIASIASLIAAPIINSKKKQAAAFAALPREGPMQVNITEQHERSGRYNCGLTIDVKLSQKDWRTIDSSGLGKRVLMTGPAPSGDYSQTWDLEVSNLKRVTYFGFFDTVQMADAKATLIANLHGLKAALEEHQEGPKTESFEI